MTREASSLPDNVLFPNISSLTPMNVQSSRCRIGDVTYLVQVLGNSLQSVHWKMCHEEVDSNRDNPYDSDECDDEPEYYEGHFLDAVRTYCTNIRRMTFEDDIEMYLGPIESNLLRDYAGFLMSYGDQIKVGSFRIFYHSAGLLE